jgi:hypothetical protein
MMTVPNGKRDIRETPPRAQRKTFAAEKVRRRQVPKRRQG